MESCFDRHLESQDTRGEFGSIISTLLGSKDKLHHFTNLPRALWGFFYLFLYVSIGYWTQYLILILVRQVLYCLSHSTSPFFALVIFFFIFGCIFLSSVKVAYDFFHSFNRYHFCIYLHVYTLFAPYSSSYTFPCSLCPTPTTTSKQNLFHPPVLWFCRRKA
jgi:hypothetical protein